MSLNGAGQSVGIFQAGDLENLFGQPFWGNVISAVAAQTILNDSITVHTPQFEPDAEAYDD